MFRLKHITLTLATLLVAKVLFSQTYQTQKSFYIRSAFYSFYDNEPILQLKNFKKRAPTQPLIRFYPSSFSIGFQKQATSKQFWSVSIDLLERANLKDFSEMTRGHYTQRSFIDLKIQYLQNIILKNRHLLFLTGGLVIRGGEENYLYGIFPTGHFYNGNELYETYFFNKTLADLGVLGGVKYQLYFNKHYSLNIDFNHTFYAYTYSTKDPYNPVDYGPSRSVSFLSFGVAYNYGGNYQDENTKH